MGIKARKYIIKNFCAKRNIIAEKKIFEELTNEKKEIDKIIVLQIKIYWC